MPAKKDFLLESDDLNQRDIRMSVPEANTNPDVEQEFVDEVVTPRELGEFGDTSSNWHYNEMV